MGWLSSKNIKSTRPTKKISERWLGSLPILKNIIIIPTSSSSHLNRSLSTSIQYFSFRTSQGIKNTKFALRASCPNHHLRRRGMGSLSNTGIKAQGKKIMLFGEIERFQSRPRKIPLGTN
ncbi:hypothetical protein O181_117856 [Austropuccinia psidii MF-1]|uniref:Uncharacterized protein n=1 Tax=Austropuccinia psidii MF-1 TaxID=1389203 RepID=A0A9Q3KDH0_9BASI|nr:hypothetical protein [Austropuccinia psidii MF-1]